MRHNAYIHHRRSIRLKGYNYSKPGAYFITICCHDRAHLFGGILNGEMVLNKSGMIAHNVWLKTPEIRKNVELDVFVIMPNHMHAIIINETDGIGRGELRSPDMNKFGLPDTNKFELPENTVTGECNSLLRGPSNNIGAIVRGYKSSVTKQLNLFHIGWIVWQRNYHEHIIRNDRSYQTISKYIINNPSKWINDKFYYI